MTLRYLSESLRKQQNVTRMCESTAVPAVSLLRAGAGTLQSQSNFKRLRLPPSHALDKERSGKNGGSACPGLSQRAPYPGIPVRVLGHSANGEKPSPLHASLPSCASQSRASTESPESNHGSDEQEMLSPLCSRCLNRI